MSDEESVTSVRRVDYVTITPSFVFWIFRLSRPESADGYTSWRIASSRLDKHRLVLLSEQRCLRSDWLRFEFCLTDGNFFDQTGRCFRKSYETNIAAAICIDFDTFRKVVKKYW